jgi:uncharacterized membrane protein
MVEGAALGATILFGTGLGIAFFKLTADLSDNAKAMRVVGAEQTGAAVGERYWRCARLWFWLGVPGLAAVLRVFVRMG